MKTNNMYVLARIEQLISHLDNVACTMGAEECNRLFISHLKSRLLAQDYVGGTSKKASYHLKLCKRLTKWAVRVIIESSDSYKSDVARRRARYDAELKEFKARNPFVVVFSFEGSPYGKSTFNWYLHKHLFKIAPSVSVISARESCEV